MDKKAKIYGVLLLSIVAVAAVAGLLINSSGLTGEASRIVSSPPWRIVSSWQYLRPTQQISRPILLCQDSDGKDVDLYNQNLVIYRNQRYTDTCSGGVSGGQLREATCIANMVNFVDYNCPSHTYCYRGRCMVAACGNSIIETQTGEQCDDGNNRKHDGCSPTCQAEQCTETDGGINPTTAGITTRISDGVSTVYTDYCLDPITLREYACGPGTHLDMNCNSPREGFVSCNNGACV